MTVRTRTGSSSLPPSAQIPIFDDGDGDFLTHMVDVTTNEVPELDEVDSLDKAVKFIRHATPEIGIKKLVLAVRQQFPMLEESGVKVGSKEVREAAERLQKQQAEVRAPAENLPLPCPAKPVLVCCLVRGSSKPFTVILLARRAQERAASMEAAQLAALGGVSAPPQPCQPCCPVLPAPTPPNPRRLLSVAPPASALTRFLRSGRLLQGRL
eukprot:SAG22_NODE_487_length_9870_cov_13.118821_10_plen_211_part_00